MPADKGPFWLEIRLSQHTHGSRTAYNELYTTTSLAQIASYYVWLLEQFMLPAGASLLDVSCGSGELVRLANQRGLSATGVDIAEVVLRTARQARSGHDPFVVGAGETLPFADSSFDFV